MGHIILSMRIIIEELIIDEQYVSNIFIFDEKYYWIMSCRWEMRKYYLMKKLIYSMKLIIDWEIINNLM